MATPNLDEATRKALNELTAEEVSSEVSYAYEHEILWYGIEAVAHTHLMRMANDISKGRLSRDGFIKKYELGFNDVVYGLTFGFSAALNKIESDGIFIPQQAYWDNEGKRVEKKVYFFERNYLNRVFSDAWADKENAVQLIGKKWVQSDLENPKLIEQGLKFGRDMWQTCVEGFCRIRETPQPQKVTDLGNKLVAYYSASVFNIATS